ncbi:MAG: NAD(P)-binding domain-containing protein [Fimbriimonas sp.]
MSEATFIGLGDMGSALARTLLQGGRQVKVWNRTASKAEALFGRGVDAGYGAEQAGALIKVLRKEN